MRLYLSSYRLGDRTDRLLDLVGGRNVRVLLSMNALDHLPDMKRESLHARAVADFTAIGIRTHDFDLRHGFTTPNRIRDTLAGSDLVWFNGGNAFTLMMAMTQSGFVDALRELLAADAIAYGGYSAGAVVAGPTLRGFERVDSIDPVAIVPPGYTAEICWNGMGLVNDSIVPHFQSDHFDSHAMTGVVKYLQDHGLPYRVLRDGEALLVDGETQVHLRA